MGFRAAGPPSYAKSGIGFPRGFIGVPGSLEAPTRVDYESESRRSESCRAHYKLPANAVFSPSGIDPGVVPYHTFDHLSFSQGLRWTISSAVFRWGKGLPRPTI